MRIIVASAGFAASLALAATGALAVDCTRIEKLHGEGRRPADIARELGITTPQVQECIAGEAPEDTEARPASSGLPLATERVLDPEAVPRGPDDQR
jgi:hypothetical protein